MKNCSRLFETEGEKVISIENADCIDWLTEAVASCRRFSVVIADPPDNINLAYQGHEDSMSHQDYAEFCASWVAGLSVVCERGFWVSFNSRNTMVMANAVGQLLESSSDWKLTICTQVFTFGNQRTKPGLLTNNHRPIWFVSRGKPNFNEVREPSWRQQNGDKRADPRGKLVSDVFNFARVVGNSKQRRAWHPTQLNEKLVERCLLLTTQEGDHVLDIFAGTGTTGRVCRSIGRKCTLVEKSSFYCDKMAEELLSGQADSNSAASADQDANCVDGCDSGACNGQAEAAV